MEIKIKNVDPVLLFGIADKNLKILQKEFPITIVARGNTLLLQGDEIYFHKIEEIVHEMISTANRKNGLSEDDVQTIVRLQKTGQKTASNENDVLMFTKSGAIRPRTDGQVRFVQSTQANDIVFAVGPAGTGKTFLAVAVAVAAFKEREVSKIILTRPAIEAGEQLGFLPGDLKEKMDPYLQPLYDALRSMVETTKLRGLIDNNVIEIVPLAYMRGRTLNNAYVILDEAQNSTAMQMKMFLTRLGANSKAIITGDISQIDLPKNQQSGLIQVVKLLKKIDGIDFIQFDETDVVRHRLVKEIILAYNGKKDAPE